MTTYPRNSNLESPAPQTTASSPRWHRARHFNASRLFLTVVGVLLLLARSGNAATRFVNLTNPFPAVPYTNWATAATSIQPAVDAAEDGDEIVVADGVYQAGIRDVYGMNNRVAITKPVTVRSLNGLDLTQIVGYQEPETRNGPAVVRCAYLTNGAVLAGFTLTNGATQTSGMAKNVAGGGVWCEGTNAVISNCVIIGNSAASYGGGA